MFIFSVVLIDVYSCETAPNDTWGEVVRLNFTLSHCGKSVSVAADGALLAVGCDGVIVIYQRDNPLLYYWTLLTSLKPVDVVSDDGFGSVLDMDEDVLVASASGRGTVYVFLRDHGGNNTWGLTRNLVPSPTPDAEELFGTAVAVSANIIAVPSTQAIYLFERDYTETDMWGQKARLRYAGLVMCFDMNSLCATAAHSFVSVAMKNGEAIVGVPGAACIYSCNTDPINTWVFLDTVNAPDSANSADFGRTVGITSRFQALISSASATISSANSGAVYVYSYFHPTVTGIIF